MNRRLTVPLVVLTVAALGSVPAQAAKAKPKPKPIKGSYDLTLVMDPTTEATASVEDGCSKLSPAGYDDHAFTVPAKGTLDVKLVGDDPTGGSAFDWDLYVYDAEGLVGSSHGATATEEVFATFKKKTPLVFTVCNLIGTPSGTVTYTFTYK